MLSQTSLSRTAEAGAKPVSVLPVLYCASLLSYVDRTIFSLSLQPIKTQFGFSDSQLGLLAGLAFALSYAAFSPVAGWFADRRSRKTVLIVAVTLWSAATLATALANSFGTMFAARALVGMGEAAVMPLAVSLLSDTRSPAERGRAFGLFHSASALGTVLAMLFGGVLIGAITRMGGLTLPLIGTLRPWQSLFVAAACLGVLFVVAVGTAMREPPRRTPETSVRTEDGSVRSFVAANPLLLLTLYVSLSVVQMATITNFVWIVPALARAHGLDAATAALTVGSTAGIAMIFGSFAAGWMISKLRKGGDLAATLKVCVASVAVFACFTIPGYLTPGLTLSLVLVTIGAFFSYAPTVCAFAMMGEALPSTIRARLAGFNTMSNAVICNSMGSLLVGVLGDRLFEGQATIAHALTCVILIGTVVGSGLILVGLPIYRRRMRLLGNEGAA
jgi:MFS family permease